jgi:hypothetical protein
MILFYLDIAAQILATVSSVLCGWFVRKPNHRHIWGCIFGLLSEPFFIYTYIYHQQWVCIVLTLFFTVTWVDGILNYKKGNKLNG